MPYFDEITLKHPIVMQAVLNWTMLGTTSQGFQTLSYTGDANNRGTYHIGTGNLYQHVLSRGGRLCLSSDALNWASPVLAVSKTAGTTIDFASSFRYFDGFFWALGATLGGAPAIMALPSGTDISIGSIPTWIDRTADITPTITSGSAVFMRKASPNYYFLVSSNSLHQTRLMRAAIATATTTGFATISTTHIPSEFIGGYGVRPDGATHLANDSSTGVIYRSSNSGVAWASIGGTSQIKNYADFHYSTKFSRWVFAGGAAGAFVFGTNGMKYSDDDGLTWTPCKMLGSAPGFDLHAINNQVFTHIERMTSDGSILIGIAGTAPLQIWISLNGGKEWAIVRQLLAPYYDPSEPQTAPCAVINDGTRIMVFLRGLNGDESVWTSGTFGTPGYYLGENSTDPHYWKP